jgi:hypothetical protein
MAEQNRDQPCGRASRPLQSLAHRLVLGRFAANGRPATKQNVAVWGNKHVFASQEAPVLQSALWGQRRDILPHAARVAAAYNRGCPPMQAGWPRPTVINDAFFAEPAILLVQNRAAWL